MMEIGELRRITRLSQRRFAEYFGIPIGTLRNWEQGISNPPEYVFQMIFASIRRDKMINIETIRFMKMLDELAELSENGISPFEEATQATYQNQVFYDARQIDGDEGYRVVQEAYILDDPKCFHHDIISYYDQGSLEYKIRVIIDEEGAYIEVKLLYSDSIIVIDKGSWYFD